jgi:hypothetical protein
MFTVGFLAWTWDAFDFFTVSMTVTELAAQFNVANSSVSWVSISQGARKFIQYAYTETSRA